MSEEKFFKQWPVFQKIIAAKRLCLFLDFDGTLSPIVSKPHLSKLPPVTREILRKLAGLSFVDVAIISGRALSDVKRKVGLRRLIYVGNHGFEMFDPRRRFVAKIFPDQRELLKKILKDLKERLEGISGVIFEDKGMTVSVHYRLVSVAQSALVDKIIRHVVRPAVLSRKVRLRRGKKVFEIVPPVEWNKGQAVKYILSKLKPKHRWVIYIGDDTTDEDAFKVLKGKGLTIKVGEGLTSAKYRLPDTAGVVDLLRDIFSGLSSSEELKKY